MNVPESFFFETTHYPLTLVVVPGDGISFKLSYNAARFDAVGMKLLLDQFCHLLINMANNAQASLKSLSLIGEQSVGKALPTCSRSVSAIEKELRTRRVMGNW